jgi:hypothetical protein
VTHALTSLSKLVAYGAAIAVTDDPGDPRAELTPLGRMLADSVFAVLAPDPAADAGTLLSMIGAQARQVRRHDRVRGSVGLARVHPGS